MCESICKKSPHTKTAANPAIPVQARHTTTLHYSSIPVPSHCLGMSSVETNTQDMDFPLIRRERSPIDATNFINGILGDRRPHVPERNLPGGGNWVVQKFGGTSVGKFPIKIAEEVVQ